MKIVSETRSGYCARFLGKYDVRVLVRQALRDKVLKLVHGNRVGGRWGVLRTAARLRSRYYWPGWSLDVREAVSGCLACKLGLFWLAVLYIVVRLTLADSKAVLLA
jgi:Integrase zinc binding domain